MRGERAAKGSRGTRGKHSLAGRLRGILPKGRSLEAPAPGHGIVVKGVEHAELVATIEALLRRGADVEGARALSEVAC